MRLRFRRKNTVLGMVLLAGGLYFLGHAPFFPDIVDPGGASWGGQSNGTSDGGYSERDVPWRSRDQDRLIRKNSWVEQGDFLPLNVSYKLLAGAPPAEQRFLVVGLSSVKRPKESYLTPTLRSLFSQSSPEERSSMLVVLLLADLHVGWRVSTVAEIKSSFPSELEQGQLVVIHVPRSSYPTMTGLKRNYNDPVDRVMFRSKQNLDYAFLIHFSAARGRYYLQLEDDVTSAKNFFSTIRRRVMEQEAKKTTWAMMEFSTLGYIGKLYKSEHLPLLARFLFLFYQEMPCDWLMSHFRVLLTQKDPIKVKPSLFQHIGTFSSFRGTLNKLKDEEFEEGLYTNPEAQVFSDMVVYQTHAPQLAWDPGKSFFWANMAVKGNHLTVVFSESAVLTQVLVETGSQGKDLLESGRVELGRRVVSGEGGQKTCEEFVSLGPLIGGRFEGLEVDRKYSFATSCLRILVTEDQKDWVIVQKIRVQTKKRATKPEEHL